MANGCTEFLQAFAGEAKADNHPTRTRHQLLGKQLFLVFTIDTLDKEGEKKVIAFVDSQQQIYFLPARSSDGPKP